MIFRIALLVATNRCSELTDNQRALARRVALRPRYRHGDERLRLDHLTEEQSIATLRADKPALLASALASGDADLLASLPDELVGKIDWAKLLDWLVANLPKILEMVMALIALFQPAACDTAAEENT